MDINIQKAEVSWMRGFEKDEKPQMLLNMHGSLLLCSAGLAVNSETGTWRNSPGGLFPTLVLGTGSQSSRLSTGLCLEGL